MFIKCPKCELNYMEDTEKMCKVCYREIHGTDRPDEPELCSVCNEAPVMPGKDVCLFCFKEMNDQQDDPEDAEEAVAPGDESVSTMDEIVPELGDGDDIPDPELQQIDKDLSLEEMEEKEQEDDEAFDDDDR